MLNYFNILYLFSRSACFFNSDQVLFKLDLLKFEELCVAITCTEVVHILTNDGLHLERVEKFLINHNIPNAFFEVLHLTKFDEKKVI